MTQIAFLIDRFEYETAGTERQLLLLARAVIQRGFDLRIVSLRDASRLRDLLPVVEIQELGIGSLRDFRSMAIAVRTVGRLRRDGVRLVHCWFNDSSMLWPPLARSLGISVVVSRRDLGFWYSRAKLQWLRMIRRAVDIVVANSDAVRLAVLEHERFAAGQVRVIPNGVWEPATGNHRADSTGAATVLSPGRWIVAVANLRPLKRLDLLVRALAEIESRHPDVKIAIVGADKSDSGQSCVGQLRQLGRDLGVGDKVVFAGSQADPRPFLEQATICVLASDTEGLSNSLIEYALAGRPIVCSDIAANREIVSDRESGLLFLPGSASELPSALETLLANPALAASLAARAKIEAQERFSVETMVRRHCELYRELIDAADRRR